MRCVFVLKGSVTSSGAKVLCLYFEAKWLLRLVVTCICLLLTALFPSGCYQSVLLVFKIKTAVAMRGKVHFGYASKNAVASSWLPCMVLCLYFQAGRVQVLVITCSRHVLSKILFPAAVVRACFACICKQNGFYH